MMSPLVHEVSELASVRRRPAWTVMMATRGAKRCSPRAWRRAEGGLVPVLGHELVGARRRAVKTAVA